MIRHIPKYMIPLEVSKPKYNKAIVCYGKPPHRMNGFSVCWYRKNKDGKDIFTILGTSWVMEYVTHWCYMPKKTKDNND